ncbi:hypothetical protein QIH14_28190, partial [Klebsiella pneumoniae]|nr:hypothetical protein [Klebsiella pneumoniae]
NGLLEKDRKPRPLWQTRKTWQKPRIVASSQRTLANRTSRRPIHEGKIMKNAEAAEEKVE